MIPKKRMTTEATSDRTNRWISVEGAVFVALAAVVFGLAGWIVWTFNRGIEFTDEAFYVLNGKFPNDIHFYFSPTQWLSAPLWRLTDSLAAFRASGFVILTLGAGVLATGLAKSAHWFDDAGLGHRYARWQMIAASLGTAWLYGALTNFSPSYNLLSAAGVYGAVGLFLYNLDHADRRRSILNALAMGVVLGLTVIAKFSSGISATGLILGMYLMFWRAPGSRWLGAVAMAAAVPFTVFAVAACFDAPSHAWAAFRNGLALASLAQQNEPVTVRLLRNWAECQVMFESAIETFRAPLVLVLIATLLRRRFVTVGASIAIVAAVLTATIIAQGELAMGGTDRFATQSMPLIAIVLLVLVATLRDWVCKLRMILLVTGLFFLPFLIAIGTGNPLPFQIILSLAPWGLLCALLSATTQSGTQIAASLFCLILLATTAGQIVSSGVRAPYRLAGSIMAQAEPIDVPGLGWLRVDPATRQFVGEVTRAAQACGISPGRPYLGFYNLPGVALILNAVPLETPWLYETTFAQAVLQQADPAQVRSAIVGVKLDGNGERVVLPAAMSRFPQGYRRCGEAMLPFQKERFELWAPAGA